jgi:iron complex transport system ATP-binding protein
MSHTLVAYVVAVQRGERTILRDVSLSIEPGEMTAIIGANGAGKSTLLSVLAGELEPASGHVSLMGRPLSRWHRVELARRRACVHPVRAIEFPFLVEELVALGRHPHPRVPELDRRCVAEAMTLTETDHLAGRNLAQLSTGERQRVELARAIAQLGPPRLDHPTWLLLDEPTANLDLAHALLMLERLQQLCRRGYGVAMVVHDLSLALRFADRVVLLHRQGVLASGPPELFVDHPELLREGFGIDATVITHPQRGWPIVLPVAANRFETSRNA